MAMANIHNMAEKLGDYAAPFYAAAKAAADAAA
jgi:hypothetical protein